MTKIIPVLQGGLGNQLFIYSAARRLALQTRSELVLDNKSGFERDVRYKKTYDVHYSSFSARHGFYGYTNRLCRWLLQKSPEIEQFVQAKKSR